MRHFILFMVAIWPAAVYAEFRDASGLQTICIQYEKFRGYKELNYPITIEELRTIMDAGRCDGYIAGTIDLLSESEKSEDNIKLDICTPPSLLTWNVLRVFLLYSFEHREYLHKSANSVVQKSLLDAFDCAKQVPPARRPLKIADSFHNAKELQNACIMLDKISNDKQMRDSISTKDIVDIIDAGRCEGYITGTMDFMAHLLISKDKPIPVICAQPSTSALEVLKKYLQYSLAHEEELHHSASSIVQKALFLSFRCNKR